MSEFSENNIFTRLMSMDEETWHRHSNPWSVWTRVVTGLPAVLSAIWSIRMFEEMSLLFLFLAFFWLWLNPRIFAVPLSTDNWASKVTFGERIWLNRKTSAIPPHHQQWAFYLSLIAGLGFIVAVVGAFFNLMIPTIVGGVISWFGKMWFCDRMVWLYENMQSENEVYKNWLR